MIQVDTRLPKSRIEPDCTIDLIGLEGHGARSSHSGA